jgi:isopenicillin N synthase-like dioxygenase
MARGLRLDDGFFADHYTGNATTALRIGGFPVLLAPPQGRPYIKEAAERALLTIVAPAAASGSDGVLLCYVEPMLERLTHGHYVAAAARSRVAEANERPSLGFIFAPGPAAVLAPLAAMRPRPGAAPELAANVPFVVDSARLR